jgi:hypothetical protein
MPALVRRLLVQDWEMPDPARWRPAGADIHDRLVDILPLYADVSQRARASGPG